MPAARSRWALIPAAVLLLAPLRGTGGDPPPASSPGSAWLRALPGYAWSFPRDHWAHPGYRTEWWYLTGNLVADDDPGREFGYQLTFFRVALLAEAPRFDSAWASRGLVLAHAAITDPGGSRHRFTDVVRREVPLLGEFPPPGEGSGGDSLLAWCLAPAGTDDRWRLAWNGDGFSLHARDDAAGIGFTLATHPVKPLVLEGPGGLSRKGEAPGEASLYYSFTRLATEGTLTLDGETFRVHGSSWMDKEFGSNQLPSGQIGWDWFSLGFDDGRDLMLYLLRDRDGGIGYARGTLVATDGTPVYLDPAEWRLTATAFWTSPSTGARYPAAWDLELPRAGIHVAILPLVAGQENVPRRTASPPYWEGAVRILAAEGRGEGHSTHLGRGYVELTGYAPGARPGL